MNQLQIKQTHKREMSWERGLLAFFILFQISITLIIYQHDAQSGFVFFALLTTTIKSIVIGAVMIEVLRGADHLFKKYWLNSKPDVRKNLKLIAQQ